MRIALVGDLMLGRLINKMLKHSDPAYPWGNTLPILQSADLRICNLECVLSDIGNPWSATHKVFHFRSDEKNIKTLQVAGINIVSLANNHVLDDEYEALQRMLNILNEQGILNAGAGNDLTEASKPAFCQIRSQKIALVAFTDNEPDWAAQENKPGVLYMPTDISDRRIQNFLKHIENLRKEVDFLIVSAHWGSNWGYYPPGEHVSIGHAMIDAGADLIFGHSAHVFRGIEVYKNRPIIYSAGDFIDDYAVDEIEKNDESFIFVLEKERDSSLRLYLYPTCIDQFQVNLASPHRERAILSQMESLCKDLGSKLKCFSNYAFLEISNTLSSQ
jgi:poly-gamma-glutamate capsule biosynthesis protein CapA/YwtB (metallophosphatase superfamily)